jgi:hypothetical protein
MMNAYLDQRHTLDRVSRLRNEAANDRLVRSAHAPGSSARLRALCAKWLHASATRLDAVSRRLDPKGQGGRATLADAGTFDDLRRAA